MNRILVGEMAGADEDFGSEVWQLWLIFAQVPSTHLIQDDPHEPTDLFKIINFIYCLLLGHV
jgi:hypothetical protein